MIVHGGSSSTHEHFVFKGNPRNSLIAPRQETSHLARRSLRDGKARSTCICEPEDFLLNVRREPDEFHDLTHPFARQAAEPREISVVLRLASPDHVLEVDCESHDLRNSGQAPACGTWRIRRRRVGLRPSSCSQLELNLDRTTSCVHASLP